MAQLSLQLIRLIKKQKKKDKSNIKKIIKNGKWKPQLHLQMHNSYTKSQKNDNFYITKNYEDKFALVNKRNKKTETSILQKDIKWQISV